MILHKGDETISCEKEQLDIMKKAGWSREKPPEAGTEEDNTNDDSDSGTDADDTDDTANEAPVEETEKDPAPKTKKKLKKKS